MERNNDISGIGGASGGGYGDTAGTSTELSEPGAEHGHGISDRARQVREKAGQAKNSLADVLETGAGRLRQRVHGGTTGTAEYAGATGDGSVAVTDHGRLPQVADRVAGGMQATADWLRETDLDSMKGGIERQVKEHPGRSLLIALGLGYVIGKAFRK